MAALGVGHVTPDVPRLAQADEAAAVAEVYLAARRAAEPDIAPMIHTDDETRGWIAAQLAGNIGSPDLKVWVTSASVDGPITALMITDGDWLEQLYVATGHTRRGIGSMLVDHAKALSPGRLQLWTFQSNLGAQRFYQRHGFVEAERTDGSDNEEQAPDIRYVWTRQPMVRPIATPLA